MTRSIIAGGAFAIVLILLALAAVQWLREQGVDRAAAPSPAITSPIGPVTSTNHQDSLYGRITTNDGASHRDLGCPS